ncbi:1,3(4)-beta-glucanase [Arthroderma uncinatum]|uniref:1,3(4)-beta-glucanase n=1 Tax=Arthroderma uncinatum TaxID=74035 RepID=UPI00144AC414|nr:1,3(4)-beta-glucanase [Arthroderma uncinatum]KAF3484119.1 1,3(4)-beta-glucanase [Arthroderma uncinatum]
MRSTGLLLVAALAKCGVATYILEDDYQPNTWFDQFRFFSAKDPTHAYVNYLDQAEAQKQKLIDFDAANNTVYLGVDHDNIATGEGRSSVRLETKKTYNHGLIVADIEHMPGGACGTWPAFWTTSSSWPSEGELDIIEGVNTQKQNAYALHTADGCSISQRPNFSGKIMTPNCDVKAAGQAENQGCLIEDSKQQGYGPTFNQQGGGIFATEWTSNGISIWFFPRGSNTTPADINSEHPDPSKWTEKPVAHFGGEACNIDKHVRNQRIIFNTAFCGGWADGMWPTDEVCSKKAPTCMEYVQKNPEAFVDTYWSIRYMKVYQQGTAPTKSTQAPPVPSSSAQSTIKSTSTTIDTTSTTPAGSSTQDVPVPTVSSSTSAVSQPTGQPTQPSNPSSADGTQPTDAPSNGGNGCPKPTPPACRTFVTTKVFTVVKTVLPTDAHTTANIIPIPSSALNDDKGAARRRRRDMARHVGRGHHN